ncbi:MAG: phage Gp37/Gp68 family protein [Novosphingobium sp.]|nr:phage Gp37/Gp68 family protein [Novosphingobium sp.]
MADKTKIEWTDATWNPIRARNLETGGIGHFCVHMSPGCKHCYSEGFQPRFKNPVRFAWQDRARVEVFLDEEVLLQPLRWKKRRMIFPCSMTDLFGEWVSDEMIDRIVAVMALCPQHTFQVLTKRSDRMREYLTTRDGMGNASLCKAINEIPAGMGNRHGALRMPLSNVWLGVSVEDRPRLLERALDLDMTPAVVRFWSAEPLLADLGLIVPDLLPDWVIVGGESGPNARPMHPDWARSLRDQCVSAGVPFFFKQWGEWLPVAGWPSFRSDEQVPIKARCELKALDDRVRIWRVGKMRAGRLLDGRTWSEMPT